MYSKEHAEHPRNSTNYKLYCTKTRTSSKFLLIFSYFDIRKPLFCEAKIIKHLEYLKAHKNWTVDQWMKVHWIVESKFEIFGSKRRQYVRRRSNERYYSKCSVPTVKDGGENIFVWGCFNGLGIGDLKNIDRKIDKKVYQQILICHGVPTVLYLVDQGFVYQQDNDPKHTSQLCKKYSEKKKLRKGFSF